MSASRSISARVFGPEGGREIARSLPDEVAVAVTCNGSTQAVMMCSPSDLEDFARGFALTEGYARPDQIERIDIVEMAQGIEARLWIAQEAADALGARRRMMMGPVGCGLCGIDSLEQAMRPLPVLASDLRLDWSEAAGAVERLRAHQPLHDLTHAVHAAGFLVPGHGIICAREDVGRHNALDKLIGALLAAGITPSRGAMVMTSRISVELVQKAVLAGCAVLLAASAPTAQAVRMAQAAGLSVAGFARGGRIEIFTHPERVRGGAFDVA